MPLRLYNSLTRKIEDFKPRTPGTVQMFVCGPTVYDLIHAGNARTFTIFDTVARWLRYRGFTVTYIQNITDIDDKIIQRAKEAGSAPLTFAQKNEREFLADMKALGNEAVSQYARATDHIPQVIAQVKALIEKKNVYLIEGDGWYFDLTTFPDYGKLSGRTGVQADDAVSRIDDNDKKRNRGDFCVWKLSKPGEPIWQDTQLGDGRPGWHIEDTAITEHAFGPQYDIHGGGMDLKFPHHEAEIAQQEAASGLAPFVRYWMHAGFLQVNAERMGKSKGNFDTLRTLLEKYNVATIRFYFLSAQYRAPLDYSEQQLAGATAAMQRISELLAKLLVISPASSSGLGDLVTKARSDVETAMDDDFNTAAAFAAVFELIRATNSAIATHGLSHDDITQLNSFFEWTFTIFGIIPEGTIEIPEAVQKLIEQRTTARDAKEWATSDALRTQLDKLGWHVDDTPYGPVAKKK